MNKKLFAFLHNPRWQEAAKRAAFIVEAVCCVICGIIALYMFVQRFLYLSNPFIYDELYSAITASPKFSFSFVWHNMLSKELNLPLFNVLLFGWNRIFPYTPFWMHLFSTLLGACAVLVAWFLAPKQWNFLKKWIFVTLMSSSFILVWYISKLFGNRDKHIIFTYNNQFHSVLFI